MDISFSQNLKTLERFDSLYQYFFRRYELEKSDITFKAHRFTLMSIKNVDQLLDELIEQGPESEGVKDERLPYWAEIWPSSIALAEYILQSSENFQGLSALELGCGAGLAGMAAALQGAEVLVSDYQSDALRLTELNWLLNLGKSPSSILLDWRQADLDQKFDLIIAADVVYEKRFIEPLIVLFEKLLNVGGKILLSEPNRKIALDFFSELTNHGFAYEKAEMITTCKQKLYHISIYSICKK